MPAVEPEPVHESHLGRALRREDSASGNSASSGERVGLEQRRRGRSAQPVADRLGEERGEVGVGQQQPPPRGDAVGLVVEPVGEELREVGDGLSCGAVPSGGPRLHWCCACRRWRGSPSALCGPGAESSSRLTRAQLRASSPGYFCVDSPFEEPAIDLVDDLQVPRQERLEEVDRPTSPAPLGGACGLCRRASVNGQSPRPGPSPAGSPRRAGFA
jgi:hypothetical protein